MAQSRTRRRPATACLVAAGLIAAFAATAAALPAGVIALHGKTSQALDAEFTYETAARSINGFAISYTCRGKVPQTDSDVYTIVDGKTDSTALAKLNAAGKVNTVLAGQVTRFTEDGPAKKGAGHLVLHAKLKTSHGRRSLSGTVRVINTACPSKVATFKVAQ
jgi:hypothetical protein